MRAFPTHLVNPPVSSREAFAAIDAKNDRLASELPGPVELSPADLVGEHQGTGYEKPEPVVIRLDNRCDVPAHIAVLKLSGLLPECFELADGCVMDIVISKP